MSQSIKHATREIITCTTMAATLFRTRPIIACPPAVKAIIIAVIVQGPIYLAPAAMRGNSGGA